MNTFRDNKLTRGAVGWGGGGKKKKLKRRIGSCFTEAPSFPVYFKAWRPTPRLTPRVDPQHTCSQGVINRAPENDLLVK